MAHPQSTRYVPIREAVCAALLGAPALGEVKAMVQDREAFDSLPSTRLPALGVFFSDSMGGEQARWASNRRDHSYQLEVWVAVASRESAQACDDLLLAYVEAVEDALRAAPTLGGLVRWLEVALARRARRKAESYWHARAVLQVTCARRTG